MASLNIQGIEPDILAALETTARQEGASVNTLVLRWILQEIDQTRRAKLMPHRHHDLDDLAGAWTAEEAAAFQAATERFQQVDTEQWR